MVTLAFSEISNFALLMALSCVFCSPDSEYIPTLGLGPTVSREKREKPLSHGKSKNLIFSQTNGFPEEEIVYSGVFGTPENIWHG
jgi:hypothetical protein